MSSPLIATGKIAFVEWHDAQVDAIVIQADEPSVIAFAHLPVYHQVHMEKFQLWSYRASLELFGLHKLVLEGAVGDADYISAVATFGDDGVVSSGKLQIDKQVAVRRIEVIFGSGRRVDFDCTQVRLLLHEAIEHVEDWHGAL